MLSILKTCCEVKTLMCSSSLCGCFASGCGVGLAVTCAPIEPFINEANYQLCVNQLIENNDKFSPRLNVVEKAAGKKLKTEQHRAQLNM